MFDDRVADDEIEGAIVKLRQITRIARKERKRALHALLFGWQAIVRPPEVDGLILHFARTISGTDSQKTIEPPMSSTSTAAPLMICIWSIMATSRRLRRARNSRLTGLR
jgi:hypothetical protein